MTSALLLAATAHLFWAAGITINTTLRERLTPIQVVFWRSIVMAVILTPVVLFTPLVLDIKVIAYTALLTVALYGGNLAYNTSIRRGSAQVSVAVTATVPAAIAILSIAFLGTRLSMQALALIGCITAGLAVITWPKKKSKFDTGALYALLAVLLWAAYFTFITHSIEVIGLIWANYISALSGTILLSGWVLVSNEKSLAIKHLSKKVVGIIILVASLITGAQLAYGSALQLASPAIVGPVATSYAALVIIASSLIYKDAISRRQWIGISITIVSVITFTVLNS